MKLIPSIELRFKKMVVAIKQAGTLEAGVVLADVYFTDGSKTRLVLHTSGDSYAFSEQEPDQWVD